MFPNMGSKFIYCLVGTVNLITFTTGTVMSWSSSQITKLSELSDDNPLGRIIDDSEAGWLGSLPSIGGLFGPALYGFLMEKIGKRYSLLLLSVPYLISYLTMAFATDIALFYVARTIAGLGVGASFLLGAVYVAEICRSSQRGLLTASSACFLLGGTLFSYCVGPYTSVKGFNLILAIIPAIFAVLFFIIAPESPYYLIANGKIPEAKKAIEKLRGSVSDTTETEIQDIQNTINNSEENGYVMDLFKTRAASHAFMLAIVIVSFQQFSGMGIILSYTEQIFKGTSSKLTPAQSSIVVGAVQFITSPITSLLTDKFGRRILFLFSIGGSLISEATLGVYFYLQNQDIDVTSITWMPLLLVVIFIFFFNCGLSALPWTVISEIFPTNVKSIGSSIANTFSNLLAFCLTYFFHNIIDAIGMGPTFWMYSGFLVLGWLFVYFKLPETKGKTMQEIQDMLSIN